MNPDIVRQIEEGFVARFRAKPAVFRSPGRINIIGEHTDYNDGFVLPAAIDKAVYIGIQKRDDQMISLYSEEFGQEHEVSMDEVRPSEKGWPNYILGVVDQLKKRGFSIDGFNLNIMGDVPIGSGLSSSAAVECATVFALNELFDLRIEKLQMALMAQKAEHEFAKVMCGIMDQFASMFGRSGHVMKLDCRTLEYDYIPVHLEGFKLVLFNTNVKHNLGDSEYNTRREQCEEGVRLIRKSYPEAQSLRDANIEMVEKCIRPVDPVIYKRCKYVVEEKERLLAACDDLREKDVEALGKKLFETHSGLSHLYEVSCAELDYLVEAVRYHPGVAGARMMGGGFGGCTINIIKEEVIDTLIPELTAAYSAAMGKELSVYIVSTDEGSCRIS